MRQVILYGEGKADAIFLRHLVDLYDLRFKVDKGRGGTPRCVAQRLVRQHLMLADYDEALLLLDSDLECDIPDETLEKHNITLVQSHPLCLEGMLLGILEDCPRGAKGNSSEKLKKHFHKQHLGTNEENVALRQLPEKCNKLFTKQRLAKARKTDAALDAILHFLGV